MFSKTQCAERRHRATQSSRLSSPGTIPDSKRNLFASTIAEVRDRFGLACDPDLTRTIAPPFAAKPRERLIADLGERPTRRHCLRVDGELDHRGPSGGESTSNAAENSSVRSTATENARTLGKQNEVGVEEVGSLDPPGIVPLLVHPDRPVHAVVDDDDDDVAPNCTAVASSWPVIRKSPSPATRRRSLGWRSFAAMAAGTP